MIVLNEKQRRYLEVKLARLEDALLEMMDLMRAPGPEADAQRARVENDLPAGFGEAARPALELLLGRVRELTIALDLPPRRVSTYGRVAALLATEIVELADSTSRHLRRYGEVDPGVAERLDPATIGMGEDLSRIQMLLRQMATRDAERQ